MNCPKCGNEMNNDEKFCSKCGYKLVEEKEQNEIDAFIDVVRELAKKTKRQVNERYKTNTKQTEESERIEQSEQTKQTKQTKQ
ncbi:MAG: zinc ribbon domain-containing protein, partial [Lachnospiraceae bacterium]|nr:zinc ribbon domain-containing protein [Lachnospiraceae bacterium]